MTSIILVIKKAPLWCKPGRLFFRSQCEDGFLTHLELPAKPPPRAAWDTNSELLSPAPRRKLWKNLPTSQYHLERCLPQSTSLTLGSPLQACIRCGNIVPLTPLHQPVTTAASLRVGPLWEHCKQNGCTMYLSVFGQHFNIIQHNHQATFCSNWSEIFTCPTAHVPCLDHSCSHSELGTSRSWVCWINKTKNQE